MIFKNFFFLWYWLKSLTLKGPGILYALPAPWLLRGECTMRENKTAHVFLLCQVLVLTNCPWLEQGSWWGAPFLNSSIGDPSLLSVLPWSLQFFQTVAVAVVIKVLRGCVLIAPHHNLGIAGISQLKYNMCWKGSQTKLKACFKTLSVAFACIVAQLLASQQLPPWLPLPLTASLGRGRWELF